jgi:hypothetical protein
MGETCDVVPRVIWGFGAGALPVGRADYGPGIGVPVCVCGLVEVQVDGGVRFRVSSPERLPLMGCGMLARLGRLLDERGLVSLGRRPSRQSDQSEDVP